MARTDNTSEQWIHIIQQHVVKLNEKDTEIAMLKIDLINQVRRLE